MNYTIFRFGCVLTILTVTAPHVFADDNAVEDTMQDTAIVVPETSPIPVPPSEAAIEKTIDAITTQAAEKIEAGVTAPIAAMTSQDAESATVEAAPTVTTQEPKTAAPRYNFKPAVSLHGTPKYQDGFAHLDYVNPDAPKGGRLQQHVIGTFDSLNPFIVKGTPAAGLNFLRSGLVFQSLMQNAWDEPFSLYGVLAEGIDIAADKSSVTFKIRDEATWADGKPVTAHDVVWTFKTLKDKGQPFFRAYYNDVTDVVAVSDKIVTFTFAVKGNAELPLIVAEIAILPQHYWTADGRDFTATSLTPPLGSGAYHVGAVDAGKSITYERNPDWWGKDLPFFKGMYNFDTITYDYYRDENVAHEAFLSREYDYKMENIAKTWEQGYDLPADKSKDLIKAEIEHKRPAGMQAFVYNIRRPVFEDVNIRKALSYAFDFEWSNKQFAYGAYTRTTSYFDNSPLASTGLPTEAELEILNPFKGKIPESVFTTAYQPPKTDGSGNIRMNMREAIRLITSAGYTQFDEDGIRYKPLPNGEKQRLEFEILHASATFERWVLPFIKNLKRIGAKAEFRVVDAAQFQRRVDEFDYDMLIGGFGQSNSPGNEQREFWGSDKADIKGSRNYIGVQDPVIDDIVTQIIHATSREDLITKTQVLDRVLLANHYVIPMWHYPKWRVAYWNTLARPETLSDMSPMITETWWSVDAESDESE